MRDEPAEPKTMKPCVSREMALAECRLANRLLRRLELSSPELNQLRTKIAFLVGELEERIEAHVMEKAEQKS